MDNKKILFKLKSEQYLNTYKLRRTSEDIYSPGTQVLGVSFYYEYINRHKDYYPLVRVYPLKHYLAGSNIFTLKRPEMYLTAVWLEKLDLVFPDHVELETTPDFYHKDYAPIKITIEKVDGKTIITLPPVPEDIQKKRDLDQWVDSPPRDRGVAQNPNAPAPAAPRYRDYAWNNAAQLEVGAGGGGGNLAAGMQAYINAAQPAFWEGAFNVGILREAAELMDAQDMLRPDGEPEGPPPIPPAP